MATPWFDALLGRLFNNGAELELRGGLNFVGFTITPYSVGGKPAGWTITGSGGGGGGDVTATYTTTADEHTDLANSRRLVAGSGVTLTDAGAGSTLTISSLGVGDTQGFSPTFRTDTPGGDVLGVGATWDGVSQAIGDTLDLTYSLVYVEATAFGGSTLFLELPPGKAIIFSPTAGIHVVVTTSVGTIFGYVGVVAEGGASVTIPSTDLAGLSSGDSALIHMRACTGA